MEHWEMVPMLDCILTEPSFLRHRWLKVDGNVPYKRADSQASASVSICFWAVSSNLSDKIGILHFVLRAQASWLDWEEAGSPLLTNDAHEDVPPSLGAYVQRWEASCGSQVWKRGLIWLQVSISLFSSLKSRNTCFPKKNVMDLDLLAFLIAMDVYACWEPSIMRAYISCINISVWFWGLPQWRPTSILSTLIYSDIQRLLHDWWHCKREWMTYPWCICAEIIHLPRKRKGGTAHRF